MRDRYYKQELLQRLHYLAKQLEADGKPTKIIRDAIRYIAEDNL